MTKKSLLRSSILLLLFSFSLMAQACEINLSVSEKSEKATYTEGDEIVVEVKVIFVHRDCHIDISETKFTASGAKIVGDCLSAWRFGAITVSSTSATISSSQCEGCGKCVSYCKKGAISAS